MKGKELRARKAKLKRLQERTDQQAFNQSLFSVTAFRHGRKPMADSYYKDMKIQTPNK